MVLETKVLDSDRIICVLDTKPAIFHSTVASQRNHITKTISKFFRDLLNNLKFRSIIHANLSITFSVRREYLPVTMEQLQLMIDTDRLNTSQPIDLIQLCNTGIFNLKPETRQYGFMLKDEGIEKFTAKIHIEVQHATELVIATIERLGGIIRTAYYDMYALSAMKDPVLFFDRGVPIPKRMIPPQDAIEYYTDPKTRGYLADPEAISHERLVRDK